jgi:eukaryotic-like serine/threonine-protein kinase
VADPSPPDPRAVVQTLMRGLGFVATVPELDVGETITPNAMAARARGTTRAEGRPDRSARARADDATGPLPRIDVAETASPSLGAVDYVVNGILGEGGMGRVLSARQRSLGRDVAIKVLRDGGDTPRASEMLLAEALVTGSLEHPSIVPVHALGTDAAGRPILVMKRIEGVAWSTLLKDDRHEAWSRIEADPKGRLVANVEILIRVCDALHYAHSRGVVHRDVKPSNIMLGAYGEVYVVDWGVALRVPRRGEPGDSELAGTPSFMAPEMAAGELSRIDARTDVYLVGATLHAVLTGQPRHALDDLANVLVAAILSEKATYDADVPAELAEICNRACAPEPADRFQSALELRRALSDFLRHRTSVALSRRLAPLEAELATLASQTAARSESEEQRTVALLSECRFGYEQALRDWPSNVAAAMGLRRVLGSAIRVELAQGDAIGARVALTQLIELGGAATLATELEGLVAVAEAAARTRAEKLTRLERDTDLRVGAKQRGTVLLLVVPISAAVGVFVLRSGQAAITHEYMVAIIALMNAALWLAIGIGRKKLLETAVNRRLVMGAAIMLAAWLLNRTAGWAGRTPVNVIGATDLFVLAVVAAAGWAPYLRRFAVVAVFAAVSAIAATAIPRYWTGFFAAAALLVLVSFASLFVHRAPADPGPGPGSAR